MSRDGERAPLTRQRSEWFEVRQTAVVEHLIGTTGAADVHTYARRVHDGHLPRDPCRRARAAAPEYLVGAAVRDAGAPVAWPISDLG